MYCVHCMLFCPYTQAAAVCAEIHLTVEDACASSVHAELLHSSEEKSTTAGKRTDWQMCVKQTHKQSHLFTCG